MKYIPVIIWLIFILTYLSWVRKGHGGWLGNKIRQSDWHCWNEAIKEKQLELEELLKTKPSGKKQHKNWLDTIQDVEHELQDIVKSEPRK
jgi:hypothetical protein